MSSKAGTGAGAVLKINTTGSTYVAIAQVKSFAFGGQKWSLDDITNAASPAAGGGVIKESIPAILDYGTMDVEGVFYYSDTGQQTLMTNFQDGALTNFKFTLALMEGETTTNTEYDFAAYITDMPAPVTSFDKAITFKCSLKINNLPTFTVGA
jgi:hypothetical protein